MDRRRCAERCSSPPQHRRRLSPLPIPQTPIEDMTAVSTSKRLPLSEIHEPVSLNNLRIHRYSLLLTFSQETDQILSELFEPTLNLARRCKDRSPILKSTA